LVEMHHRSGLFQPQCLRDSKRQSDIVINFNQLGNGIDLAHIYNK
jgi:hypothetical protein